LLDENGEAGLERFAGRLLGNFDLVKLLDYDHKKIYRMMIIVSFVISILKSLNALGSYFS